MKKNGLNINLLHAKAQGVCTVQKCPIYSIRLCRNKTCIKYLCFINKLYILFIKCNSISIYSIWPQLKNQPYLSSEVYN